MAEASDLRPIAGHEGRYSVTRDGRVWSHPKMSASGKGRPGKWLAPGITSSGYPSVRLCRHGVVESVCVHALVAGAYIARPTTDARVEVNHINGIKTDNRVENLEWVTRSENVKHAHRIGLHPSGESKLRRLTMDQARQARALFRDGVMQKHIAARLGVSKYVINGIVRNHSYKEPSRGI